MLRYLVCAAHIFIVLLISQNTSADEKSWSDRLTPNADFRLRYESIEAEGLPDRNRGRYRLRMGLAAELYDDINLVVSLATGAENPVSRNVTFGDSFGIDEFGLELAYVDWQISAAWRVYAGKMKNPMMRAGHAPLIYDSDLNPEGLATKFSTDHWFANIGAFVVEEGAVGGDSFLYHVQSGFSIDRGRNRGNLLVGAGYFTYTNTVGRLPFFFGLPRGNTVDTNDRYVFDYENSELFFEYETKAGRWPLQLFGQWTKNHSVTRQGTAYAAGMKVGKAAKPGMAELAWTWQDIEADAVIGAFNDSDFGGGGTDASGHIIELNYFLRDHIWLAATLMLNKVDAFQRTERDYRRLQLDIEFKFN
ncbi:MAG TPA: putative porin [Woeseiaceae bacterium]|nr:putative porin [Woeseiaceae bacterium]